MNLDHVKRVPQPRAKLGISLASFTKAEDFGLLGHSQNSERRCSIEINAGLYVRSHRATSIRRSAAAKGRSFASSQRGVKVHPSRNAPRIYLKGRPARHVPGRTLAISGNTILKYLAEFKFQPHLSLAIVASTGSGRRCDDRRGNAQASERAACPASSGRPSAPGAS